MVTQIVLSLSHRKVHTLYEHHGRFRVYDLTN